MDTSERTEAKASDLEVASFLIPLAILSIWAFFSFVNWEMAQDGIRQHNLESFLLSIGHTFTFAITWIGGCMAYMYLWAAIIRLINHR